MISRRIVLCALGSLAVLAPGLSAGAAPEAAPASAPGSPTATITEFYGTLLATMKQGQQLGFAGRRAKLAEAIQKAFDLPLMTRLMVGPQWLSLSPVQQQQLVSAFSNFSIATYANRFDDYSGERFNVDSSPVKEANGDVIVRSKLIKSDGSPVQIDYLLHSNNGAWQIVDVYLSGTVSELATRRSEFSSVLRRGGAQALVDLLHQKTAELSG